MKSFRIESGPSCVFVSELFFISGLIVWHDRVHLRMVMVLQRNSNKILLFWCRYSVLSVMVSFGKSDLLVKRNVGKFGNIGSWSLVILSISCFNQDQRQCCLCSVGYQDPQYALLWSFSSHCHRGFKQIKGIQVGTKYGDFWWCLKRHSWSDLDDLIWKTRGWNFILLILMRYQDIIKSLSLSSMEFYTEF